MPSAPLTVTHRCYEAICLLLDDVVPTLPRYLLWMSPSLMNSGGSSTGGDDGGGSGASQYINPLSGGAQLLHERKFSFMKDVLPMAPGATAAAPGMLHMALAQHQRSMVEFLFRSLLSECHPGTRSAVLLDSSGSRRAGQPLLAKLIRGYPETIAQVLADEDFDLEVCGDQHVRGYLMLAAALHVTVTLSC